MSRKSLMFVVELFADANLNTQLEASDRFYVCAEVEANNWGSESSPRVFEFQLMDRLPTDS